MQPLQRQKTYCILHKHVVLFEETVILCHTNRSEHRESSGGRFFVLGCISSIYLVCKFCTKLPSFSKLWEHPENTFTTTTFSSRPYNRRCFIFDIRPLFSEYYYFKKHLKARPDEISCVELYSAHVQYFILKVLYEH